jgi:ribose transport system permease protein
MSEEAARFSGIKTDQVIIAAYVICKALTMASAIDFAMSTRSISPASHGNFYELYAIPAGARGGESSIIASLVGVALLQGLQNLANLLGIPSSLNFSVVGRMILLGVLVDQQWGPFRERRRTEDAVRGREPKQAAAE